MINTRTYLGASAIGHQCQAFKVFTARGFPGVPHTERQEIIFALGHACEDIVIDLLEKKGYEVLDRQLEHTYYGGHIQSHMDGRLVFTDEINALLEVKSARDEAFNDMMKWGVRYSMPRYYAQCQVMMDFYELNETYLYILNKNTAELRYQIIEHDPIMSKGILEMGVMDITSEGERCAFEPEDWRCVDCDFRNHCWHNEPVTLTVKQTCLHCTHSFPKADGTYWCSLLDKLADAVCINWRQHEAKPRTVYVSR